MSEQHNNQDDLMWCACGKGWRTHEHINSLAADLEQARERIAVLERDVDMLEAVATQAAKESEVNAACADGMQEVARGFEQELDAARRDNGRLMGILEYVHSWVHGNEDPIRECTAQVCVQLRSAIPSATTPTTDPRDAVVSAAREALDGLVVKITDVADTTRDTPAWDKFNELTPATVRAIEVLAQLDAAAAPARGEG